MGKETEILKNRIYAGGLLGLWSRVDMKGRKRQRNYHVA